MQQLRRRTGYFTRVFFLKSYSVSVWLKYLVTILLDITSGIDGIGIPNHCILMHIILLSESI